VIIQDESFAKAERGAGLIALSARATSWLVVRAINAVVQSGGRCLGIDLVSHSKPKPSAGPEFYETLKTVPAEGRNCLEVEGLRIIIRRMESPRIWAPKVIDARMTRQFGPILQS